MDTAEKVTATGQLSPTSLVSGANKARTERVTIGTEQTITSQKSSDSRSVNATVMQRAAIGRDNATDIAVQETDTGYQSTPSLVTGLVSANTRTTLVIVQETHEGRESSLELV